MRISLGWKKIELRWGDGSVSVEGRPLTREANALVSPFYQKVREAAELAESQGKKAAAGIGPAKLIEIQEIAEQVFPKHVRNLAGLEDAASGEVVALEKLWQEAKLGGACMEIMSSLVILSGLSEEERGNSERPVTTS